MSNVISYFKPIPAKKRTREDRRKQLDTAHKETVDSNLIRGLHANGNPLSRRDVRDYSPPAWGYTEEGIPVVITIQAICIYNTFLL